MTNQRGSIIPAIAVVFGAAVVTLIFGYMLWPKASDLPSALPVAVNRNVNGAVNANLNGNSNANANSNVNVNSNVNTTTDATEEWKTYTSTKYGITFKYPADWTVSEGAKTTPYKIDVYPKTSDGWATASAITFWVASTYSVRCGEDPVTVTSNVTIGGMTATMYSVTDKKVKSCIYKHYNLDISPVGWGENPEINVMADANGAYTTQDKILATLKLTNPTAGWKTYESTALGFTAKYPSSWTVTACGEIYVGFDTKKGICGSEYVSGFNVKTIELSDIVTSIEATKNSLSDPIEGTVTVGGKTAQRIQGVYKNGIIPGAYQDIVYVKLGLRALTIHYIDPQGKNPSNKDTFTNFLTTFTFTK